MVPALRLVALVAALLLSSCATISHKFTCPAQGGAEWRELRSEHVLLQTDLSQGKAEELLRDAEQMRALVLAALFKQPPQLPDRIHLVAFRTDRELWEFTGEPGLGSSLSTFGFRVEWRSADPLVAMAPAWGKYRSSYLAHLTHMITWQLSGYLFPGQPDWYRVGLATYMETLAEDDGGRRFVGKVPGDIVAPPWQVPDALATTLQGGSPMLGDVGLRSPGWLLVRWLSEARPAEYLAFLKQISAGSDGAAAWVAVFPNWNPKNPEQMAQLEAELQAFIARGKFGYREVSASATFTWRTRSLEPAEVHEARIRIRRGSMRLRFVLDRGVKEDATTPMGQAKALRSQIEGEKEREVAESLAESPLHPVALRLAAGDKEVLDPAKARASTDAYPQDWRSWLLLGDALQGSDPDGAKGAYRKAAELGTAEPVALLGAARGFLATGDTAAALPAAREAARLVPFSDEALAVLAASAARAGACPEALRTLRRLHARLAEGKNDRLDDLVADSTSRCAPGASTALAPGAASQPGVR